MTPVVLTSERIEQLREDRDASPVEYAALCDLALAAKEMEEELAKARYHVLGYKGDYDELCKRYTTCERELGSVMKERDAMREAIQKNVEKIRAHHSYRFTPWLEDVAADLEQALKGGK